MFTRPAKDAANQKDPRCNQETVKNQGKMQQANVAASLDEEIV